MEEEIKSPETVSAETTPENPPEQAEKTYSEQEYNDLKSQLDTVNETLKSYKDYKKKWEQSESDRKAFEHKTKVGNYVKSLGLKDDIYEKHVTDLILEKGLKFDGDKLIDDDNIVNNFKEKYPNAFKSAQPVPEFSVSTTGQSGVKVDDAFIRKVMGLK
ncbi:MAG: hypothetical protein K2J39_13070 [Ruminococcus sp.]|nr:hypothetical protein [Ruminococcus sp.]